MADNTPVLFTPKNMPAANELLQEGRYRINQPFLEDEGCSVYEAFDSVRNANVLVKEIPVKLNKVTTVSQQETLKLAFTNQAKILTQVDHESLLHVHDFFSEIGRQYLVMESVDGDDLNHMLARNKKPFAVSEVTKWADQLLDALNYLHNYKPPIIHRNIKPENVKLNSDGKIKLLAFGLADGSDTSVSTMIGNAPTILNYSPLEQIWDGLDAASQKVITNSYDERSERVLKEPVDARTDIYALGATLYHLLTAREPIDALERSIDILEGKPDPLVAPNKIDPNIPSEISDVLMKAMEIKRENRYDSAVILRQVLRTAVIRVNEREAEDTMEQEEAAEALRYAAETRHDQVRSLVEQKRFEMEAEQKRQAEVLEQKLREAEELRLKAEQRAAEAERLLKESEAGKISREVAAAEQQNSFPPNKSEAEKAVLKSTPAATEAVFSDDDILELDTAARVVFDDGVVNSEETSEPQPSVAAAAAGISSPDVFAYKAETAPGSDMFSDHEYPHKSLPIPAIAGGAVVLVFIALGIWLFLPSGSSEPTPSNPVQATTANEPAANPNPVSDTAPVDTLTGSPAQTDTVPADPSATQTAVASKTTPAKTKKPAADTAKTPQPKKSVTADDLINDN